MKSTRLLAAGAALALVGSAALSPAFAQDSQTLTFQAAFPAGSSVYESLTDWAEQVGILSGGRLEIELLPAGAIVPAFQVLDAVHSGVIDGAHSAVAYSVGKNRAATLFGPAPGGPFGMDLIDLQGWLYHGGGMELYEEFYQDVLQRNVKPLSMTYVGNQALGWFSEPVESWEDLAGLKCRQTGITAEVFSQSGMQPVNMPGGEIVPAGERGVIECAEWIGPAEDATIGFQRIWKHYYLQSIHEPATALELLINLDVWNGLSPDLQAIVETTAYAETFHSQAEANMHNGAALTTFEEEHGVTVHRTPEDILNKTLEIWDEIAKAEAEANPFFEKVYDAQRAYASKVVPTRNRIETPYSFAAEYYWSDDAGSTQNESAGSTEAEPAQAEETE